MAGIKYDELKPRLSLVDPSFLEGVARVLGFGEQKYGGPNWMEGLSWTRVLDAAKRHILSLESGEEFDPETGERHTLHAACCLMMINHYMRKPEYERFDDRRFAGKNVFGLRGGKTTDTVPTEPNNQMSLDLPPVCEPETSGIAQTQERIKKWADRVYPDRTAHGALVKLMLEEIPELLNGGLDDPAEYADTLILLLDIAQMRGIDALQAVNDKMGVNEKRVWKIDPVTKLMRHIK